MNFLPLVIAFLLIFGAISASFMTNQTADKTEALAYQGRLRALRLAYNEVEEHEYDRKKILGSGPSSKKMGSSDKNDEKPEEKSYFRILRMGSIYGAINLARLAEKDIDNKWLKKKTAEYLEAVYGNTHFIKELKNPNWAEELLDFFIVAQKQALKEKNTFLPLSELCPEGPLKKHFARLIRGTNSFDPSTGRGYLPLERCITFDQENTYSINIHFANPEMLIVFFGEDSYQKIREEEWPKGCPRKKALHQSNYSLKKKELKKLLGNAFDAKLERLIDEDYHLKGKYDKRASDPKTFISAQVFEDPKAD